mgnify:CR=1 FL=1
MSTINSSEFYGDLQQYKRNPTQAHYRTLELFTSMLDGATVDIDPSSPFVFALDCTAVNTAMVIDEHESSVRRLYPNSALIPEDLYKHMSDKDYVGRFALPSNAMFTIAIELSDLEELFFERELRNDWVGSYQVIIPRNTFFQVGGVQFSIEYGVSISRYDSSGWEVKYLTMGDDSLELPASPTIQHDIITSSNEVRYIRFAVTAHQYAIETRYDTVSYATGRYFAFEFPDQFYKARFYVKDTYANIWNEVPISHDVQVVNPSTPMVLLRVLGQTARFEIPYVFINSSENATTIRGKVKYEVYSTKGRLGMDLGKYNPEQFQITWYPEDVYEDIRHNGYLNRIKNIFFRSDTLVDGGRAALSFDELKDRVMQNALGRQNLPITNAQLSGDLVDFGFEIKADIDTVTNRVFQASKETPNASDPSLLTPASVSMQTVPINMSEVATFPGVSYSDKTVTLTSDVLYKNVDGRVFVVDKIQREELFALDPVSRARKVNESSYHYSPYYYVLDVSSTTFEVRPYHMDAPTITTKTLMHGNTSLDVRCVYTQSYGVFTFAEDGKFGYVVEVKTDSNEVFKGLSNEQIQVYVGFVPTNSINGMEVHFLANWVATDIMDGERTYQFRLYTEFAINADNEIEWTNEFEGAKFAVQKPRTQLTANFNIYTLVTEVPSGVADNYQPTNSDSLFKDKSYNSAPYVISMETMTVRFGDHLKNLWSQSRSNVGLTQYKTYEMDIPATYDHDVYKTDNLGREFTFNAAGELVKEVLHKRGDFVYDVDGTPVIAHRKGDTIKDSSGNSIELDGFKKYLTRYVDIMMIEGAYYFVTDKIALAYKDKIKKSQVEWIINQLPVFEDKMLEQTKIFFHPKTTSGKIRVLTPSNTEAVIDSAQSLKLILHVSNMVAKNFPLRAEMIRLSVLAIDKYFKNTMVAVSEIEDALREVLKGDTYNIELVGVTGESKFPILTVLDPVSRLGIKKRLVALPDGTLTVEEDISVDFQVHGKSV